TLTELHVPDRAGVLADVLLGYATLAQYRTGTHYLGATIGRVANRIGGAAFELDGRRYHLTPNEPPNHLHGGVAGFDKRVWHVEVLPGVTAVRCEYMSEDGEEEYPGRLDTSVLFTLTDANELSISYSARSDEATPVNLTNHAYFNLAGAGTVLDHELTLMASSYTPTGPGLLPTGELRSVSGTPFDFRAPTTLGARLAQVPGGYDHHFVVDGNGLRLAAQVREPASGRVMEVWTTSAGLQVYDGTFLDGKGKGGEVYGPHSGFTLETQGYPDAVNRPEFPSIILQPGQTWRHETVFRFSTSPQ
ncbi:MAG TPA: aldose epimerase family protein, partial [Gemmatimonadales bacterium]|nr:aldose epimerase family protein [Gemmatimonadales bacterium]